MNAQLAPVSFSATSLKVDLSMDARMGRKMIGLFGAGGLETRADGLVFHGRRHQYGTNLLVGGLVAFASFVLVFVAGDLDTRRNAFGFAMFGFIIGAWLTSLTSRLRAPQTVFVERARIERVMLKAALVRICTRDGDVQLTTDQATYGYLLQTLHGWGIPPTQL